MPMPPAQEATKEASKVNITGLKQSKEEEEKTEAPKMAKSDMFFMLIMLPLFLLTCIVLYKIKNAIQFTRNNIDQYDLKDFKFDGVATVTREILAQKFKEYRWPQWNEFGVTILFSAVVIGLFDKLINYITLDFFIATLKKRADPETDQKHGRKKTSSLFKFFYCVFTTTQGYFAMRDMDLFPPYFGGRNPNYKVQNMFKNYPLVEFPNSLRFYYTFVLGYHVYKTFDDMTSTNKMNDFFELMYHHTCTILLMVGSYMCGFTGQGALVSYVLDYSDLFGCLFRLCGNCKYPWAKYGEIVMGLLFNITWVIYRVIIYAFFVYTGTLEGARVIKGSDARFIYFYHIAMGWLLYLIILFWWYKIQRIVIMYFVKGSIKDTFCEVKQKDKKA